MTNEMSRKGRGDKMIVIKKQPVIFTRTARKHNQTL